MKKLLLDRAIRHPMFGHVSMLFLFIFLFLGYKNLWDINFGEAYFKEVSFSINISTKLFASFVCIVIFYHLREKIFFILGVLLLLEFYYRFDVRTHYDCEGSICNANYIYPVLNLYMIFFNYFLILILRLENNRYIIKTLKIFTFFSALMFLITFVLHDSYLYWINKVIYSSFIGFHAAAAVFCVLTGRRNGFYYLLYVLTEIPTFLNIFYNINFLSDVSYHVPQWVGHLRNFLLISGAFQRMNILRQEIDTLKEEEASKKLILAKDEARRKEIEIQNIQLESQVLKNELNPHFLFNCLNNVDYFMMTDVDRAKKILNLVSTLYRDSLILSKQTSILLGQELDFLSKYLKLEKMRYGKKLSYRFDVQVDLDAVYIPSLILQILVENSIKHGISRLRTVKGEIIVSIHPKGDGFHCEISNPYEDNAIPMPNTTLSSKTGLENTKKRLDILYKGDSHFSYAREGDKVIVSFDFSGERV